MKLPHEVYLLADRLKLAKPAAEFRDELYTWYRCVSLTARWVSKNYVMLGFAYNPDKTASLEGKRKFQDKIEALLEETCGVD